MNEIISVNEKDFWEEESLTYNWDNWEITDATIGLALCDLTKKANWEIDKAFKTSWFDKWEKSINDKEKALYIEETYKLTEQIWEKALALQKYTILPQLKKEQEYYCKVKYKWII